MDLTALHLWQRSALQPSDATHDARRARHRPEGSAEHLAREVRRAREMARRTHNAVAHGVFFSVLLGAPVGWSFVHSTLLAGDPAAAEACPALASFLPATLASGVDDLRASGALSMRERKILGIKVCDPGLRLVIEPLLRGVSDLGELRDLTKAEGGLDAALPKAASAALGW